MRDNDGRRFYAQNRDSGPVSKMPRRSAKRSPSAATLRPVATVPAPVASAPVTAPPDAASRVDGPVLARAYRKTLNKEELTRDERQVLARHEKTKEERLRWQYYGSIPQKHWRTMSGRQTKVINEQAARYGLPFGGPTVNLPVLARALHDFLAENALKLAKEDDPLLQGGGAAGSPALERYREERAALARLDRLEREVLLLPRDQVREALGRIASILRGAGDALQRQFGLPAVELLYEALDDAQREMDKAFGVITDDTGNAKLDTSDPE